MQLKNLTQVLQWTAKAFPRNGIIFYPEGDINGEGKTFTHLAFLKRVEGNARRIHALSLKSDTIILLHFDNILDNFDWFWAVTFAGHIPALSTPLSHNLEQKKKHLLHLHSLLDDPVCLMRTAQRKDFSGQDKLRLQTIEDLPYLTPTIGDFFHHHGPNAPIDQGKVKQSDDIAVLMLTSGSTGLAKAVCLTHGNVLAAVAGKSSKTDTNAYTPFFNWIGADHVANLVEIHIQAMWLGATQVHAQTKDIVQDPLHFLRLIHKHRISYTFAPNFFIASLRRALEVPSTAAATNFDLSSLRTIISGGEANVIETGISVSKLLQEKGAWPEVIKPAFGMTETCAGSIYNTNFLQYDMQHQSEFASVGDCNPGMEMRIFDEHSNPVDVDICGSLEVKGPMVFRRYYNDPKTTVQSFHDDWFITGDQGRIDAAGQLHLIGRAKETLIINGVSFFPQEVETALDHVQGVKPNYVIAFPYRAKASDTEGLAIAYCPTYEATDIEKRVETNDALSKATMLHTGAKPLLIPLNESLLQKTTLGKTSRSQVRKSYEKGDFQSYLDLNDKEMVAYRIAHFEKPEGRMERMIFEAFKDNFDLPEYSLGSNTNLFEIGVNSIELIKLKQKLEKQVDTEIPVVTIMTNPTIRTLATALERLQKPQEYDPMIILQSRGEKTPLWLIHPGVGEVLVFLGLTAHLTDRPVYAMRARGFEKGETFFTNVEEMVTTYVQKVETVQPKGPYAIAGYSYGSMVAFEIAKRLKAHDDANEIKFLGIFNLPPQIKIRMRQLDWTSCILNLAYFLDFFSEDDANAMLPTLQEKSHQNVLDHIMRLSPKDRLHELGLDRAKLVNWANLAHSLQSAAVDYEPTGVVDCLDVFYAIPLASVARDVDDWKENYLSQWQSYCKTAPRYHRVDGAHYTMLSPQHVLSFQKTLRAAMQARGI